MARKEPHELDPNPAVDNATMIAELEGLDSDEGSAQQDPPASESSDEDEDTSPDDEDDTEDLDSEDADDDGDDETEEGDDEDLDDEDEEEVEEDEAEDEDEDEVVDEATQKRLAKRQHAELRSRKEAERILAKAQEERRTWLAEQEEHTARLAKAEVTEAKLQRLMADPVGTLIALGYEPKDLRQVSQDAWGHFKADEGDPKFADYKRRAARDAQYSTALDKANERIEQLEESANVARAEAAVASFLSDTMSQVTDEHPVLKAWISSDAEEARTEMRRTAAMLLHETGENPDPIDVIDALEKFQAARLKKWGIDPVAVKKPRTKKKTPAPAAKKTTAKSLSNKSTSKTKQPAQRQNLSLDEMADDVLKRLESGALD